MIFIIVVTVTMVILVLVLIAVIVCLKHNMNKTVKKVNVIKPQTTYYISFSYIIDEMSIMTQVIVNTKSSVSNIIYVYKVKM